MCRSGGTRGAPSANALAGLGLEKVYVVVDGRLAARTVEIVGRSGNDVLVRGAIKDGERIVAETFPEIGPGVKVEIR